MSCIASLLKLDKPVLEHEEFEDAWNGALLNYDACMRLLYL